MFFFRSWGTCETYKLTLVKSSETAMTIEHVWDMPETFQACLSETTDTYNLYHVFFKSIQCDINTTYRRWTNCSNPGQLYSPRPPKFQSCFLLPRVETGGQKKSSPTAWHVTHTLVADGGVSPIFSSRSEYFVHLRYQNISYLSRYPHASTFTSIQLPSTISTVVFIMN